MTHDDFHHDLAADHDGELDASLHESIRRRIETDPQAAEYASMLRETSEAVRSLPRLTVPAPVLEAVYQRIDRMGDVVIGRINRWASGIAAAVLVVCTLVLIQQQSHPQIARSAELVIDNLALAPADADTASANTAPETKLTQWITSELSSSSAAPASPAPQGGDHE